MRKITWRFAMLMATAAVLPLALYGIVSIYSLREATRQSVVEGNLNVARRAAEQIALYISTNAQILDALAGDLQDTWLQPWQEDRILKNYVLRFPQFRELTLLDAGGRPLATSRVGVPGLRLPGPEALEIGRVSMSPMTVDDDLLPTAQLTTAVTKLNQPIGWLIGQFNLEEMWRLVDRIRIGRQGYALIVGARGQLLAHGDTNQKPRVARGENLLDHPVMAAIRARPASQPVWREFVDARGRRMLAVGTQIQPLGWTIIVEQPTREAYAVADRLEREVMAAIALALLAMVTLGYFWGRSFITPIFALMRGTEALAAGRLTERVHITTNDEFQQLADSFNTMADRLVELQEDVRKKERQAMFGRIVAGLVHDLTHPIQNIANSCKLIGRVLDDQDYRKIFQHTIEQETGTLKRMLEDLRNIARPMQLERMPIDVSRVLTEAVETVRTNAREAALDLQVEVPSEPLYIEGEAFALGRLYRNLLVNAIQATTAGGRVTATARRTDSEVEVRIADTGCGIAPERIQTIFEDFVTTKRHGLGLGLAVARRIIEQLNGSITTVSEVGVGTTFTVRFPALAGRPSATADDMAVQTAGSPGERHGPEAGQGR